MTTRERDAVQHLLVADTHDILLFFTNRGRVYRLDCYEIVGDTSRTSRGTSLANLISMTPGEERITEVVSTPEIDLGSHFVLGTRKGKVKGLRLRDLANLRSNRFDNHEPRSGGRVNLCEGIEGGGGRYIFYGQGPFHPLPIEQRTAAFASGGRGEGIKLVGDDEVVGMETITPQNKIL